MKSKLFQLIWHARDGAKNEPILSIDFHPLHSLLATAGMDNTVRIWRVRDPHTSEDAIPKGSATVVRPNSAAGVAAGAGAAAVAPRPEHQIVEFLFTISMHSKTVNALRWSPNGEWLASAGDEEGVIAVARPKPGFTWLTANLESCLQRTKIMCLNKHEIYDLSWAPDSRHLAAAFVNSEAAIVDVETKRTGATLGGHSQFVQGVAWDPANAYVATLSNDRSLRVHRNPGALLPEGMRGKGKVAKGAKAAKAAAAAAAAAAAGAAAAAAPEAAGSASSAAAAGAGAGAVVVTTSVPVEGEWDMVATVRTREMGPPPAWLAGSAGAGAPGAPAGARAVASAAEPAADADDAASGAGAGAGAGGAGKARRMGSSHPMFADESVPTFFRRPCWTPDGSVLLAPAGIFKRYAPDAATAATSAAPAGAAAAAAAGAGAGVGRGFEQRPTTWAFARDRFGVPLAHFPGTRQCKASVAVKASPILYKLRGATYGGAADAPVDAAASGSASSSSSAAAATTLPSAAAVRAAAASSSGCGAFGLPYRMLVAVATLDAVHIYDTENALPIATMAGFHVEPISDIAWSPSGRMLFVSSMDGYVSCAAFAPGELGEPLPDELCPPIAIARRVAAVRTHGAMAASGAMPGPLAASVAVPSATAAVSAGAGAGGGAGAAAGVATLQPRKRIVLQPTADTIAAAGGAGAGAIPSAITTASSAAPIAADGDHRLAMMGSGPDASSSAAAGLSSATPGAKPLPAMGSVPSAASPQRRPASTPASAARSGIPPSSAGRSPRRRIAPSPADIAVLLGSGAPAASSGNIATAPGMEDASPLSEPSPYKRQRTDDGGEA